MAGNWRFPPSSETIRVNCWPSEPRGSSETSTAASPRTKRDSVGARCVGTRKTTASSSMTFVRLWLALSGAVIIIIKLKSTQGWSPSDSRKGSSVARGTAACADVRVGFGCTHRHSFGHCYCHRLTCPLSAQLRPGDLRFSGSQQPPGLQHPCAPVSLCYLPVRQAKPR